MYVYSRFLERIKKKNQGIVFLKLSFIIFLIIIVIIFSISMLNSSLFVYRLIRDSILSLMTGVLFVVYFLTEIKELARNISLQIKKKLSR